jgi:MFS-type transporter involved in bile tolerance (Atg22 family)
MCTSDLYYANDSLNKRQWEYVVGLFALISVIVPSFGHFRVGAIVGVSSTTITGLYLFVASLVHGQVISKADNPTDPFHVKMHFDTSEISP